MMVSLTTTTTTMTMTTTTTTTTTMNNDELWTMMTKNNDDGWRWMMIIMKTLMMTKRKAKKQIGEILSSLHWTLFRRYINIPSALFFVLSRSFTSFQYFYFLLCISVSVFGARLHSAPERVRKRIRISASGPRRFLRDFRCEKFHDISLKKLLYRRT